MAKKTQMQGTAEFDWDALALDGYTAAERAENSDKYEGTLKAIAVGEVIDGTVISLNKKEVVVNIGSKSEGAVKLTMPSFGSTVDLFTLYERRLLF